MMSEEHQRLLNALANALENSQGVRVTHIDVGGTPQLFSEKYRRLPEPYAIGEKVPDLLGKDQRGTVHIGEAETDVSGRYTEQTKGQLRVFGNCSMPKTNAPVPLHVIVPPGDSDAMKDMLHRIGLGDKIGKHIHVWKGSA